ncbi:MAG: MBOAT family protein [Lachnospiraceae bacterium]|nr:MBOAT family protein [Lachnospiraceae bacterium]
MVFSSFLFLWFFFPPVFLAGMLVRKPKGQNLILLAASLLFYAWGEPVYVLLLIFSILFNWSTGLFMERFPKAKKAFLVLSVAGNLLLLGWFKYADFVTNTLRRLFPSLGIPRISVPLPIGISFFTFQAMAYVIDLYREKYPAQKDPLKLALYISFFPQLIAGPIVRYIDVERQLTNRHVSTEGIASGIRRFIYGLAKKVILANTLAGLTDRLLAHPLTELNTASCWVAAIAYTLQIYYDFSGYSDMAIGLGRIFGFRFPENFRYPYLSRSITEFWQRWHISLGTWFKEYLYIPLGGNRKGKAFTCLNLLLVFAATGLWHGATWRFVIWGLFHGFFRIVEHLGFSRFLQKHPHIARIYAILVFGFGWVIFRADSMSLALTQIKMMIIPTAGPVHPGIYLGRFGLAALIAGILGCGPLQEFFKRNSITRSLKDRFIEGFPELLYCAVLLGVCILFLGGDSYNPFIYFRF